MRHHRILIFCILSMIGIELFLRINQDPDDIDFMFEWCFFDRIFERYIHHLQEGTNQYIPITINGFRGKDEHFSSEDGLRIIVTGAGHNFANNVQYGYAWPEILERKLSEKGIQSEILNRSMNGSTVVFAQKVLFPEILNNNPTHVILSHSGYNEAILSYISDDEIIRPNHILFNLLMSTEFSRFLYKNTSISYRKYIARERQHKVTLFEFTKRYEQMISILIQKNVRVILLQQEVITPNIPGFWNLEDLDMYRQSFQKLAQKFQLQLIDPKEFSKHEPELYFDNKEYYNFKMHAQLADTISKVISSNQ